MSPLNQDPKSETYPAFRSRPEWIALALVLLVVVGLPLAIFGYQRLQAAGPVRTVELTARLPTANEGGWTPEVITVQRGRAGAAPPDQHRRRPWLRGTQAGHRRWLGRAGQGQGDRVRGRPARPLRLPVYRLVPGWPLAHARGDRGDRSRRPGRGHPGREPAADRLGGVGHRRGRRPPRPIRARSAA